MAGPNDGERASSPIGAADARMSRVAALDCGTNSLRLLVADVDPVAGTLIDVARQMQIVRLGEDVGVTGRFAPEAIERTMRALSSYAEQIRDLGAERVRMVATSATRDAGNRGEFVDRVRSVLGVDPQVIDGEQEAALSYAGATRELADAADVATPYLVVDVGGGSTEFVRGGERPELVRSVDVGSVRLTERHLHGDPPSREQVQAATRDVDAALDTVAETVPLTGAGTLIGLAGSVTTVAAIALELSAYEPSRTHRARIDAARVRDVAGRLLAASREQRAAIPVIHPGRIDVIAAGALILDRVLARTGLGEVLVSEHDILDGVAWSLA
jgi:exopolyphosphatase/guanosine-5'-triphosphate,3'-diphosphate pyrophosphatase